MNQKTRNWLLISSLFLVTGFVLLRILLLREGHHIGLTDYSGQLKLRSKQISGPGTVDQISPWQSGQFINVNSPEMLGAVKNAVEVNTELSMKQRDELQDSISRFFQAYSVESFANYFEFKTHGAGYSLDFRGETERLLQVLMASRTNLPSFPEEPKAKLEKIWEIVTDAPTNGVGPSLTQVDPGSVRILITTTNSNPFRWIFLQTGKTAQTNSQVMNPSFAPYSIFKYDETPETIRKKEGHLVMAMMEANARCSTSDIASPIYVVYYWSGQTAHWYPWVLGKYATAKFNVLF
jgi:hypothetical protein